MQISSSAFPTLWCHRSSLPEFRGLQHAGAAKQCGFLWKVSAWALIPATGTKSFQVVLTSVTSVVLELPIFDLSLRAS